MRYVRCSLILVYWSVIALAIPPQVHIPGNPTCVFSQLPQSAHTGLFSKAERQQLLSQSPVGVVTLPTRDANAGALNEKQLVDRAIATFREKHAALGAREKAALWEDLMHQIDQVNAKAPYHVSYGFIWQHEGKRYYVYQGPLEFPGGHYTLVIDSTGRASMGLEPRIDKIEEWKPDLTKIPAI